MERKLERVRIVGKPHEYKGWQLLVYDADTGELVDSIFRIEILLEASEVNMARLYYYKTDEQGKILCTAGGSPVREAHAVNFPEFDVYAHVQEEEE